MDLLPAFAALGLSEETLKALSKKGFEEPTPIQAKVIPILLEGAADVIGQAQTGTGKTGAFGLPLIERLEPGHGEVQAIILTPTRELAIQVAEELNSFKGRKKLTIVPFYGGQSYGLQFKNLKSGIDILVGTPGRILDHLHRESFSLDHIKYFILDEADEMLNMGFIDDVEEILQNAPQEKRMLFFSATMPDSIMAIAKRYMVNPQVLAEKCEQKTVALTDQIYFEVAEEDKFEALSRIIDITEDLYGIIFCRTRVEVDELALHLQDRGYSAEGLHGEMTQATREKILDKFKTRRISILVATDVAARGIDVADLTHVINYSLPGDPESYIHRVGRTGRAGKEGTAITFVTPSEYRKIGFIKREAKTDIRREKLPKIQEVIQCKQDRIFNDIGQILEAGNAQYYLPMAQKLLEMADSPDVLAAVLRYAFNDEMDVNNYREIREFESREHERREGAPDRKGRTRLFMALGEADGLTPRKLLRLLEDEVNIPGKRVLDIFILERFSFITVFFEDGEKILQTFKRYARKGEKPLFTLAKDRDAPKDKEGGHKHHHDDANLEYREHKHHDHHEHDHDKRHDHKAKDGSSHPKKDKKKD